MIIIIFITGFIAAYLLSRYVQKLNISRQIQVLFLTGVVLAFGELYKQIVLYKVMYGYYEWYFFPFQLCSVPMYICLALPALFRIRGTNPRLSTVFRAAITFLSTYTLLGAVMVFVDPSGMFYPYKSLTLHSFLWHFILIFIGLTARGIRKNDTCSFAGATVVFLICCFIAELINLAPFTGEYVDMFYISPLHPSSQIVFCDIAARFGNLAGIVCYIVSIILGAWLLHFL